MLPVDFGQRGGRHERRRTDSAAGAPGAPRPLGAQSAAQHCRATARARNLLEIRGERSEAVLRMLVEDGRGLGFPPAPRAGAGRRRRRSCSRIWRRPPSPRPRRRRRRATRTPGCRPSSPPSACKAACCGSTTMPAPTTRSAASTSSTSRWASSSGTSAAAQQPRHAPLILVPVRLERGSAAERFRLWFADEDIATNLSLAEKLRQDFGLTLPEIDPAERLDAGCLLPPGRRGGAHRGALSGARRRHRAGPVLVRQAADVPRSRSGEPGRRRWRSTSGRCCARCSPTGFRALPDAAPGEPPLDELLPPRGHAPRARRRRLAGAARSCRARRPQPADPGPARHRQVADHRQSDRRRGARRQDRAVRRREDGRARGGQAPARPDRPRRALPGAAQPPQQQARLAGGARADAAARRAPPGRSGRPLRGAGRRPRPPQPPCCGACTGRSAAPASRPSRRSAGWPSCAAGATLPPPVKLPGATHWQRAELRERRDQVAALARRVAELGLPAEHPWRGVGLGALLPSDHQAIRQAIDALPRAGGAVVQGGDQAAGMARPRAGARRPSSGSSA